MEQGPELSVSPKRKASKSGPNLRKSLAWDNAFFTSEGVLNDEELAMVNSTFRKTEVSSSSLTPIQEEMWKSTESASTLDTDNLDLESLEVDVFADLRASIQLSTVKRDNALNLDPPNKSEEQGERRASCIGPSKKIGVSSQNKMKPPVSSTRQPVINPRLRDAKEALVHGRVDAGGLGDSTSSLKPPRTVYRASAIPAMPGKKSSTSSSIQTKGDTSQSSAATALPAMPRKKPPSAGSMQTKSNISKSISVNAATRQSIVSLKRGGESLSVIPKLIPSQKNASGPSASTALNLSKKLSLEDTRNKNARNTNHSAPKLTKNAISRTSKSNIGPNSSDNPSVLKLSASASPSNSFDSSVSDSSSCSSVAIMNHSYSTESLDSGSSSTHSLPPLPSDSCDLLTDQPCYRSGNPASLPSIGDRSRSLLNSSTGANTFRPSGLRMPTPKIGYFDTEKSLVHNSRKFSSSGLQNNLKSNIGTINTAGGNKRKPNMSPSVRPAAQSAIPNYNSLSTQAVPLSSNPVCKPISPSKMHPALVPAELSDTPRKIDHEMSSSVNMDPSPIIIEDGKESALLDGGNSAGLCEIESGSYLVANQKENLISLEDTVGLVKLDGQKILSLSLSEEKAYTSGDLQLDVQISVPIINNQNCDVEKSLNRSSIKVSPCAGSTRPVVQSADSSSTGVTPLPSSHDSQPSSPSKLHPQLKPAELCQTPSVVMDNELPSSVNKPVSPITKEVTNESAFCAGGSPVCSDLQSSLIKNAIFLDDSADLVELVSQKVLSLSLSEENTCGGGASEPSEHISDPILNFQTSGAELSQNGSLQNNLPKKSVGTNNTDGGDKPIIISESASTGAATLPSSPSKLHPPLNPAELCETPRIEKDPEMSCKHNKHLFPVTREGCKESAVSVGGNSGGSSKTESDSDLRSSQKDNVFCRDETIELVEEVSQKISSISLSEEKTSACGNPDLSANVICEEVNSLCKNNGSGDTAGSDKPEPDILPSIKTAAHTKIAVTDSSTPSKLHSLLNPTELVTTPKAAEDLEVRSSANKDLSPIIGNDSKASVLLDGGISVRSLETKSATDLLMTWKEHPVSSDDTGGLVDIVSHISSLSLSEENANREDLELVSEENATREDLEDIVSQKSESLPVLPSIMDFRTPVADKPHLQFDSESSVAG